MDESEPAGEIEIIETFFAPLAAGEPGSFGLQDDAACLTPPPGFDLAVTSDVLAAGIHFFADDAAADIAYKALAVNLSDLAAKGARPWTYSLNLALPQFTTRAWLQSFSEGLALCQARHGITLIGGDTVASPGPVMAAITALGLVEHGRMVRRNGARPGDSLYVSGAIGDAALGLKLRRGDPEAQAWPLSAGERRLLLSRYLRPEPRLQLADALKAHASAALDVSDGLVLDCSRLCQASRVTGLIEATRIPLSAAARAIAARDPHLFQTLVSGGDDYEILTAVRSGEEQAFEAAARALNLSVTRIGAIRQGPGAVHVLGEDGRPLTFPSTGYEHFAARRPC